MIILSIETSCDETGVSIIKAKGTLEKPKFKVLGNTLISQIDIHKEYGGVFPAVAKREHAKNLLPLLVESLEKSGLFKAGETEISDSLRKKIVKLFERESELAEAFSNILSKIRIPKIDTIAVTYGPGLEPALWVGINFAKALSLIWQKPLVPVNHMEGHIFSSIISLNDDYKPKRIHYPALSLLVSGGHTEFIHMKEPLSYKRVGETRDDAVGEAFDKAARMMGLEYPGGPKISILAESTREKTKWKSKYPLPRPMLHTPDLDFSFSGLKTAVLYTIKKIPKLTTLDKKHIAREFEDAVVEVLITKSRKALEKFKPKTFVIGGGVIANKEIKRALEELVTSEFPNTEIIFPDREMSTDNAIMIAAAGFLKVLKKEPLYSESAIRNLKACGSIRL